MAALAGVSRSSVSRYLNGHRVREAEGIAQAIDELRYEPSPIARSLRSGRTQSIGVIVADVANPFFAAAFKGIESETRRATTGPRAPIQLFLCNTEESFDQLLELLDSLSGRVDGLIIAPPIETPPPHDLVRQGVPVVLLDREFSGPSFTDSVLVDNEGGLVSAVTHLFELGHQRIGFISGPLDTTPGRGRHEGYRLGLDACGLPWDEDLVVIGDFMERAGRDGVSRLLELDPPPTALVAANNLMSLGALEELFQREIRIPEEVSFIGFDDLEAAELVRPAITTISRPMGEQGAEAMRLLRRRLRGEEGPPRRIVLPTRLAVRGSTAPPPERKPAVRGTSEELTRRSS
ncbi:MAG: LacI family DNA-binding transcriptional regulator [Gemmatimonadota bacterium]